MPSLIQGYHYDIFVSYRQKDNKGDRWISEFVAALKTELESTFKEDISIYFDENPHDGLLETHDVDDSLKEKLKCVILIPIVSQTYCDPKSFAWKSEFVAFRQMAAEDPIGLKVKLLSGNVASRVLPVKIHDLDAADSALLEGEMGGKVRSIDFIYKSAGVNRPLNPNDNPDKNQNKTFYRDQLNKVANAVKEILQGMSANRDAAPATRRTVDGVAGKASPVRRKLILVGLTLLVLALGVSGYSWFSGWKHKTEVTAIRNGSIAILPFENQTGRTQLNSIGQVASDFISTTLIQNRFWNVMPTQDVFRQTVYSGVLTNPEAEKRMVNQGKVDYMVIGHYNIINDSLLLVASVNDVVENKVLYTTPVIKCVVGNPMKAVTDAQQFILGFLMFSKTGNENSVHPPRYDAYQEYLKGMEMWTKNTLSPGNIAVRTSSENEKFFRNAIELDKDFLPPYFKLMEIFSVDRKFKRLDSVLQLLDKKQDLFLEAERINFTVQRLLIAKDWNGLESFLLSKAEESSRSFRPYYHLAVNALYRQNKPQKALEYISRVDLADFDFENKPNDQVIYVIQLQALIKLKRFEEAVSLTTGLTFKNRTPSIRVRRWLALYYSGGKEEAANELADYLATSKPTTDYQFPSMALFRAALIKLDTPFMMRMYREFVAHVNTWDPQVAKNTWSEFVVAVMTFRANIDIPKAEAMLRSNLPVVPKPRRIHQLGLLYATTGRAEKALEVEKELLSYENPYDNGVIRYYAAKIELALGHKDQCVEYLRQSLAKGMEFGEELFEFDADLKGVMDYPPFLELVTPRE